MFERMIVAACCLAALSLSAADAPLTNGDVMKLAKAGLSAETIVAKIKASETSFDTSTDALVALAEAGLPDEVIRAMVEKPKSKPAAKKNAGTAERRRFEEITVANPAGGRCEHASLELTTNGIRTSGCHEADVNVAWKDVSKVCYVYAFRSTLAITTAAGERRLHTITRAEMKALAKAIRAVAPGVREETSCR